MFWLIMLGCGEEDKDSAESNAVQMASCLETEEAVSYEEERAGFSWAVWNDERAVGDAQFLFLEWEDGAEDCAVVWLELDTTSARYVDSEYVEPEGPVDLIAIQCDDAMVISASLHLESGDGRMAEVIDLELELGISEIGAISEVSMSRKLELDEWQGTLVPADFYSSSSSDSAQLELSGTFGDSGLVLNLAVLSYGSDGTSSWVAQDQIAEVQGSCDMDEINDAAE
jgi:hypothetical protein